MPVAVARRHPHRLQAARCRAARGTWRLHVLELATLRETALAETRSVDDQVEWLDDDTVLYGVDAASTRFPPMAPERRSSMSPMRTSPAVVRR